MDYQKVDAGLAAALNDVRDSGERALEVFVHVARDLDTSEAAFLEGLGISGVTGGRRVFSARLSARAVAELSDQPWVQQLKLSRKLRLLDPDH